MPEDLSPRQYLRSRRPERFSDSAISGEPSLDRALLEYHLETLTSRNQESDFQHFAHRLAERCVCPNLLPQTGPAGGGDSKVDSETYPVAEALTFGWLHGEPREASEERWAFAISAKKDWRAKVKSDVGKIADTGRGYTRTYFVTNQFVRDKTRGEVEDTLRAQYGMDVRILDRTWILDRVFRGNEKLAVELLRMEVTIREDVRFGPLDLERIRNLEETEVRIRQSAESGALTPAFVGDCIEAASLTRGLERPREEIEAAIQRASRAADSYGTREQMYTVAYEDAWTHYWWFEDAATFSTKYQVVEGLAKGSTNAYDMERLANLWFVLSHLVGSGQERPEALLFEERSRTLEAELSRLSQDETRPSTALQARTTQLLVDLRRLGPTRAGAILSELHAVVREGEMVLGYPFELIVEIITELGPIFGDLSEYDELFETVLEASTRRQGELASARLLVSRAATQLGLDRNYDAITALGRALKKLYKNETRGELVHALYLISGAYELVGLLWAARGSMLVAASTATHDLYSHGEPVPSQASCYDSLRCLELELGRMPHALAWHEATLAVRQALVALGHSEGLLPKDEPFDARLGRLILRADMHQLKELARFPTRLKTLGLPMSSVALQFALGHDDEELADVGLLKNAAARKEFFREWRDAEVGPGADLTGALQLYLQRNVDLVSRVLGCEIRIQSANVASCIGVSESILAALESLLSTGLSHAIMPREPRMTIRVRASEIAEWPFDYEVSDQSGRPHFDLNCRDFDIGSLAYDDQARLKTAILELLTEISGSVFLMDVDSLEQLLIDEEALSRSLHFTGSAVVAANVLGPDPRTRISDWEDRQLRAFPLRRESPWDASLPGPINLQERANAVERGQQPSGKPWEGLKHSEMEIQSLIRERLWDRAGWRGTGFVIDLEANEVPLLLLIFENGDVGKEIFAGWKDELGLEDTEEKLRVSIVKGVNRRDPGSYRVGIGSAWRGQRGRKLGFSISRIQEMGSADPQNLQMFESAYAALGRFRLAPARVTKSQGIEIVGPTILKREVSIRCAWEVGVNDEEMILLNPEDDPIVPESVASPPVAELLRLRRNSSARRKNEGKARSEARTKSMSESRRNQKKGKRRGKP